MHALTTESLGNNLVWGKVWGYFLCASSVSPAVIVSGPRAILPLASWRARAPMSYEGNRHTEIWSPRDRDEVEEIIVGRLRAVGCHVSRGAYSSQGDTRLN